MQSISRSKQEANKYIPLSPFLPKALPTPQTETKPYHTELARVQGENLEDKINFNSVVLKWGGEGEVGVGGGFQK